MPSRRRVLRLGAAAAFAALAGCANDATETAAGTGDPTTTGTVTGPPSTTTWETTETLVRSGGDRVAWTTSLPGTAPNAPTLAGETLYVGTENGTVVAVGADDGKQHWQFEVGGPVQGRPVVHEDAVLVVSGGTELGSDQVVTAIDAADGSERWAFAHGEWWLDVLGTTADTAFVATSDDALAPNGQTLYALSLADGTERWSVEVGDEMGGLVTESTVYVPSPGTIRAVSTDGQVRWSYEGEEYQFRTLSVAGGTVAFATGSGPGRSTIRGHDAATGAERWTVDEHSAYTTRAAGDRLFVGGEAVVRLDPVSGATRWTADVRAALYDAPVVEETLYVAGDTAAAIGVDDGKIAWTADLDGTVQRPAGVTGGALVVHRSASREDRNRHVVALDTGSGDRRWTVAGESEFTDPVVADGRAVVAQGSDLLALQV